MQTLTTRAPELTVGAANADVIGADDVAIQSALHLAKSRGASTVRILKGTYLLKNSIFLPSGIKLLGEGNDTILKKNLFAESPLIEDVNWYQRVVKVKDPGLFPIGGGIRIMGKHITIDSLVHVAATVIGKEDNTLILDRKYLNKNIWLQRGEPKVTTGFPLIWAEDQQDITIADLQLDGGTNLDDIEICEGGGLSMQNCDRVTVRSIYSHHNNGDGMDWQVCDHVTVENSRFEYSNLGMHPGSGAQHMVVRNCRINNNLHGFFFCWGVQHGLLEDCEMTGNRDYGISVGFHDSHNVIRKNHIHDNGEVGVSFRGGHYPKQSPTDNLVEDNRIKNNGQTDAPFGIHVQAHSDDIRIKNNQITDDRGSDAGVAIKIEETVKTVTMENNTIRGFKEELVDMRKSRAGS